MKSLALAAFGAALLYSPVALADCAGSHAHDRCLIGTWNFASGGSAAWMTRNIHMAHVTGVSHSGLTISFRPDGTFATGQVDVHATVVSNDGHMTGAGHSSGQAAGQWSASGGQFTLCPTTSNVTTTVTVNVHGHPITVTPHAPAVPTAMSYSCSVATMTTTQPIRGREPIVTVYARAH